VQWRTPKLLRACFLSSVLYLQAAYSYLKLPIKSSFKQIFFSFFFAFAFCWDHWQTTHKSWMEAFFHNMMMQALLANWKCTGCNTGCPSHFLIWISMIRQFTKEKFSEEWNQAGQVIYDFLAVVNFSCGIRASLWRLPHPSCPLFLLNTEMSIRDKLQHALRSCWGQK